MAEIDLCGLKCPMPVLRVKKALKAAGPGAEIEVVTDDPHAPADIRTFAEQSGHTIVSQTADGARTHHRLRHRD